MYKENYENVEVYFICYKKEEMELVETYYDEVLDVMCWYFNAYLAYKHWKNNFKGLKVGELGKTLLTVAASKYLLYQLDGLKNKKEEKRIKKELAKIDKPLVNITKENAEITKFL